MNNPLVSVIMPVYNCAHFLSAAIDSVLKQTFNDFEFIIVNDGSTDESEKIIHSYDDERILYYYQPNGGVANALNTGIKLATGKYIWRHDADDTSLPGKLEQQVNFLEADPAYALCATQVAFMTERGKIAFSFRQPNNNYFGDAPFLEVRREQFNPYSPITHATVLIRHDAILDVGGFRTEFQTAEDVDLWLRLIQKYKAVVLNQCNYYVRLNKASATQKHGWKNEFFRNLAFKFYDQRMASGKDDLQNGIPVVLPVSPPSKADSAGTYKKGCAYRGDLLSFLYPLHMNARDYKGAGNIIKFAIRDGWRMTSTWKAIVFPILGPSIIKAVVKTKSFLIKDH